MTVNRWMVAAVLLGACARSEDVSLRPFTPRHVRLVADGFTYLDGMLLVPPGFDGPFKLGTMMYTFTRGGHMHPDIELVTNLMAPLVLYVPAEEVVSRPCPSPSATVAEGEIVRRLESPDGLQVVCKYQSAPDSPQVWYDIVRLQHSGISPHDPTDQDLWMRCSVNGVWSAAEIQNAWDICATVHLVRLTRNVGITCREHLDINMSRNAMPECDEYEPTPLE